MLTDAEFKAKTLAHCLGIAARDPDYLSWGPKQYEELCPWCMRGLEKRVRQDMQLASTFGPSLRVEDSSNEAASSR